MTLSALRASPRDLYGYNGLSRALGASARVDYTTVLAWRWNFLGTERVCTEWWLWVRGAPRGSRDSIWLYNIAEPCARRSINRLMEISHHRVLVDRVVERGKDYSSPDARGATRAKRSGVAVAFGLSKTETL